MEVLDEEKKTVGEAVFDILSRENSPQTVEETVEDLGAGKDYMETLKQTFADNLTKYSLPFYVHVLGKKEPWAPNVLRHWFVARQTRPLARETHISYPNHFHELYSIDKNHDIRLVWIVPSKSAIESAIASPRNIEPKFLEAISDFLAGRLDYGQSTDTTRNPPGSTASTRG